MLLCHCLTIVAYFIGISSFEAANQSDINQCCTATSGAWSLPIHGGSAPADLGTQTRTHGHGTHASRPHCTYIHSRYCTAHTRCVYKHAAPGRTLQVRKVIRTHLSFVSHVDAEQCMAAAGGGRETWPGRMSAGRWSAQHAQPIRHYFGRLPFVLRLACIV